MRLTAGVGWTRSGFEVVVIDEMGRVVHGPIPFAASQVAQACGALVRFTGGGELVCVIDSNNGILDQELVARGLVVYRADPSVLPAGAEVGLVSARTLASAGLQKLQSLVRLGGEAGTLVGRLDELRTASMPLTFEDNLRPGRLSYDKKLRCSGQVYLTFDDGPSVYTDAILDILQRYSIAATFFCVGLCGIAFPSVVRRIVRSGHSLGNHTWSHALSLDLSLNQTLFQLEHTNERLREIAGSQCQLFRPPYGCCTESMVETASRLGLSTIMWTVDPKDWRKPDPTVIVDRVVHDVRDGSVILLHDGGGDRSNTVRALPDLIERILSAGLIFATL